MTNKFKIKRSDTKPYLTVQLLSANGTVIDLNEGSVFFNLATSDNNYTPVFSGLAVITGSSTGQCEYRWTTSNTNRSGTFLGEFEFISGTDIQTFPPDHSLFIKMFEDYDN